MFLAGKKNTLLKSNVSNEIICPNCNSKNSTKVAVIGAYKHLIHIPFFSGKKSGTSICLNCNKEYHLKNMPNSIKLAYYELKETAKNPVWFYAGLIGVKTLVLIKIFSRYF
jgi:DNA-directed RNA polymerase subunit RPC12/RpoP